MRSQLLSAVLLLVGCDASPPEQPRTPAVPRGLLATSSPVKPQTSPQPTPNARTAADGCGRTVELGRTTVKSHRALGTDRWPVHIPHSYDGANRHPVLILLHETNLQPRTFMETSGFTQLADRDAWVIAAPESDVNRPWRDLGRHAARMHDMVDDLDKSLCIDRERVFVVGQGAGGRLALALSCEPWIAGIATNSFRRHQGESYCTTPKPSLLLSPLKSPREPFAGAPACDGQTKLSVASVESIWRGRNRCEDRSTTFGKSGASVCYRYACEEPFASCHVDGGHAWPGTPPRNLSDDCDGPETDYPVAETVWTFLSAL